MSSPRLKREVDSGIEMPNNNRVSFGSKGSMVETWIIYDEKDNQSLTQTDHAETDHAETQFQRNILLNTGQEHEYQDNHHQTTNLQYHQHNHLYEQQNNNNNQEDPYLHEQQQQQQLQQYHHHQELQEHYEHNNNNNNNYSHHQQQQQHHHLPPSPPPPPPAKNKELRVTFSDSPLCDSRYGEPPNRVTKSASSNCDVDINNLNAAFIRRPIKRSQSLESRDNPFVPGGELAIDTEDILKRATIVRDKFILEEQEKQKIENEALAQAQTQDKTDGPTGKAVGKSPDTKGTGKDLPKENGKVDEEKAGEQATRPPTGGQTGELQDGPKDKKKQKKKCCTIM